MRFVVTQEIRKNPTLRVFLIFFHAAALVFLSLNIPMEMYKWGLLPEIIEATILGNPELFIEPKDLPVLLAEIHTELFIYVFVAAMGLLVLLRQEISELQKRLHVFFTFLFMLFNGLGPFLVLWGLDSGAQIKWMSFWGLTLFLISQNLSNLSFLMKNDKKSLA